MQGEKRRNPFGFRAFLTKQMPSLVEMGGLFDFSNRPYSFAPPMKTSPRLRWRGQGVRQRPGINAMLRFAGPHFFIAVSFDFSRPIRFVLGFLATGLVCAQGVFSYGWKWRENSNTENKWEFDFSLRISRCCFHVGDWRLFLVGIVRNRSKNFEFSREAAFHLIGRNRCLPERSPLPAAGWRAPARPAFRRAAPSGTGRRWSGRIRFGLSRRLRRKSTGM